MNPHVNFQAVARQERFAATILSRKVRCFIMQA